MAGVRGLATGDFLKSRSPDRQRMAIVRGNKNLRECKNPPRRDGKEAHAHSIYIRNYTLNSVTVGLINIPVEKREAMPIKRPLLPE